MISNRNRPLHRSVVFKIQEIFIQYLFRVRRQWVKGQCGIHGNTIVDRAANFGHQNNLSVISTLCIEENIACLRTQFDLYWTRIWKDRVILVQKGRILSDIFRAPKLCPRLSLRSRLRIGHVGVGNHMYRFNMKDSNQCDGVTSSETVLHFIAECR